MKAYGKDLTSGSLPKNLIKFALPVFLANILSSGYSIINTIWVGHLLGGIAVAAVAVVFPVVLLMVAIANAPTTACSVLIAHSYGAKDEHAIQQVVNTSWSFGAIIVLFFCVVGFFGADTILQIMGTNEIVRHTALRFLQLTTFQFVFMYLVFLLSSTLRAVGNSKTPLIFTALGTAINAILDPLLIIGVGPFPKLGLNGAAIASLLSIGITSIAALLYLWKKYAHSPLIPKRIEMKSRIISQIFGIGLPSFIQQTILSVAMAVITAFVNKFGPDATAAYGITGRIDSIVILPAIAIMIAVSTLTAQAHGAQKPERISEIYRWGMLFNLPGIAIVVLLSILIPAKIMHLFVSNPEVVNIGVHYLHIVGWAYLLLIPIYVNNGIIIGSKKAVATMLFSFVSLGCFRIPLAGVLSYTNLGLTGIWISIVISFAINAILGCIYYLSKKWMPKPLYGEVGMQQRSAVSE